MSLSAGPANEAALRSAPRGYRHAGRPGVPRGTGRAFFCEDELRRKLDAAECEIRLSVRGKGHGHARFWTCDFTENYIRINASYRT